MKVAYLLYDEITLLDIVGPFTIFSCLPSYEAAWVSAHPGPVADHTRTTSIGPSISLDDCTEPDIVVVPGGYGTSKHLGGPEVEWLRHVHPNTLWTTSVCTGSLLLGAAGLLAGLEATSHFAVIGRLSEYGATPSNERIVLCNEQRIATAAGVSSGIDLALTLLQELEGSEAAELAQLATEYDPKPPTDAGSPAKAASELVELIQSVVAPRV